jgi:hypothetical protein
MLESDQSIEAEMFVEPGYEIDLWPRAYSTSRLQHGQQSGQRDLVEVSWDIESVTVADQQADGRSLRGQSERERDDRGRGGFHRRFWRILFGPISESAWGQPVDTAITAFGQTAFSPLLNVLMPKSSTALKISGYHDNLLGSEVYYLIG